MIFSPLLFVPLFVTLSSANTMVFPILGGLLHVPPFDAFTKLSSQVSVVLGHSLSPQSRVSGGNAKTIQFPQRSLNGFGNAFPTLYGPKHIAIPNHKVKVGAMQSLNCEGYGEGYGHHVFPKKNPSVAHLNGYQKNPGIGRYAGPYGRFPGIFNNGIPLPNVVLSVLNIVQRGFGNFGTHQKM